MSFFIFFINCKEKTEDSQHSFENPRNVSNSKQILEKYFSAYDSRYFLDLDVDSIILNEEQVANDISYKNSFLTKAHRRRNEIEQLRLSLNKDSIPFAFRTYLLPAELSKFNPQSFASWLNYNEIYQGRLKEINNISKYLFVLEDYQIQDLIQGSYKDSSRYKELAINKYKRDSIESATRYYKLRDSLQRIVNPIDSLLPFGPKPLGKLIRNNKEKLGFEIRDGDTLTDVKDLQSRKDLFDIWMYFLKFHPYADSEYTKGVLPPINTFEKIDLGIEIISQNEIFEPDYGAFQARISDINHLEIYYSTTGYYSDRNGCGVHFKKEENCCFDREGFNCNSTGYLTLYNRKNQHAIIIPAYILQNTDSYGFQLQFFYIEENRIYIYQGYSGYNFKYADTAGDGKYTKSVKIAKTHVIQVLNDGQVKINKQN